MAKGGVSMGRALVLLVACASCGGSGGNPYAPRPVDPDAVRKACAIELSCLASPPLTPGGNCVSSFEYGLATGFGIFFGPSASDLARYVDCAKGASSCTDALTCASKNHGPDWCAAHAGPTCDGDVLVSCLGGWGLEQVDCTAFGQRCGTANGAGTCTDGKTCDPTATDHCAGNLFVTCDSTTKLESSVDCSALRSGGTCVDMRVNGSGTIGCFPSASASCGPDSASCDGAAAVVCLDGIQLRVECGQFASHCVVTNGKFDCVPDATSCTSSSPDSCSGTALQLCQNGSYVQVPCASLGLAACDASGANPKCM
jgi:hypothetical protein